MLCPVAGWIVLERVRCLYSVDCKLNISILKCYTGNMRTCSGQDCVRSVPITEHGRRNPRKSSPDVYVERVKRPFLLRNYKIVYCSVLFLVFEREVLFLFLWREKRLLTCLTMYQSIWRLLKEMIASPLCWSKPVRCHSCVKHKRWHTLLKMKVLRFFTSMP